MGLWAHRNGRPSGAAGSLTHGPVLKQEENSVATWADGWPLPHSTTQKCVPELNVFSHRPVRTEDRCQWSGSSLDQGLLVTCVYGLLDFVRQTAILNSVSLLIGKTAAGSHRHSEDERV